MIYRIRLQLSLLVLLILSGFIFSQAAIDSRLTEAFSKSSTAQVVVTFKGTSGPSLNQVAILKSVGIIQGITFQSVPVAGIIATAAQVNALAKNSEIKSLYLNRQLEYYNYNSTALTGVDKIRSTQEMTSLNGRLPVSGKGVGVLINDSGIDGLHDDLKFGTHVVQNVLGSTNLNAISTLLPITYLENIPNTDNNSGHGTHVAGIVGGTGAKSAGKYEGVAPGADLVGYGSGAVLLILDGIGGFDYALTNQIKYKIRIVTNSWGTSGSFDVNDPINQVTYLAYKRGISVLFSASNSGPGEDTHNPYAVAPWVISVAAGNKYGQLADFSSRGLKGQTGSVTINGETFTWKNEPTITAPGVGIVSTKSTISPLPLLGDDSGIETAYQPFYTTMDGTSMSCPHAAGIAALILEANPKLSPSDVKRIFQLTATNMPNYESWECGAGYINAYAAVDYAFHKANYGSTVNSIATFNSNAIFNIARSPFEIDYYTLPELSPTSNQYKFNVAAGTTAIEAKISSYGLIGEGNPVNLVLISPDGVEFSSGVPLTFAIEYERSVFAINLKPGEWILEVRGIRGDPANPTDGTATPELISGIIKLVTVTGYTGLNDITGNSAEASIKLAVAKRLVDGYSDGKFRPDNYLKRYEFAQYLMMGQAIRQFLPFNNINTYSDLSSLNLSVESVTAKGAAIRDIQQVQKGVMIPANSTQFNPMGYVNRYSLAYSLVQSLGLQNEAVAKNSDPVTVLYNGNRIPIDDESQIPAQFRGYVQLALDLNLINAYFSLTQGPNDLSPVIHATFKPTQNVKRGEFAVIATRTHDQWTNPNLGKANTDEIITERPKSFSIEQNYPNPFNPSTIINFSIPKDGIVTLEVFNMIGEKVGTLVNEFKMAGTYSVNFKGNNLASGIYLYRISSGDFTRTMKMNLLK